MKPTHRSPLSLEIRPSVKEAPNWLRPFGDRVLVLPATPEEVTAAGILLPVGATEAVHVGVVVACGPDAQLEGELLTVGRWIAYPPYVGQAMKLEGVEYLVMPLGEALGWLVPK